MLFSSWLTVTGAAPSYHVMSHAATATLKPLQGPAVCVSAALVPVPNILSNPKTDSNGNGKYLLLNSEFQNDTRLTGFQYYGVSAGVINLTVKITFILLFIYSWTTI